MSEAVDSRISGETKRPPLAEWQAILAMLSNVQRRMTISVDGEALEIASSYELGTIFEPSSFVELAWRPELAAYEIFGRSLTIGEHAVAAGATDVDRFSSGDPSLVASIAVAFWLSVMASTLPRMIEPPVSAA
jgi:hypothetical protein